MKRGGKMGMKEGVYTLHFIYKVGFENCNDTKGRKAHQIRPLAEYPQLLVQIRGDFA